MFQLAMKMLRKNFKSTFFYFFVMTCTIAISFLFTAGSNGQVLNENIAFAGFSSPEQQALIQGAKTVSEITKYIPTSDYLNSIIVMFCCFLIFYVNNYYIYHKKNEIAILEVCGASQSQIIYYFLLQTALLFLIACIPGMLLGLVSIHYFFNLVAQIMHTAPGVLTSQSFIQTIILIAVIFVYMVFYILAYISRLKIKDLLATHDSVKVKNEPPVRALPNIVFPFCLVMAIVVTLLPEMPYSNQTIQLILAFTGLYGIINGFISDFVHWWKRHFFHKHPLLSISISNYNTTLLTSRATIMILLFAVLMMQFITFTYASILNEFLLSISGYVIAIVLLSITITFDLSIQAKQKRTYFLNLWKIGYTRKQLVHLISQEMILFYGTILILVLSISLPMSYRFLQAKAFDPTVCAFMILFFIGFVVCTGLLSYFSYVHTTLKAIVSEK